MSTSTLPNSNPTEAYQALTPGSAALAAKARTLIAQRHRARQPEFRPVSAVCLSRAGAGKVGTVDGNKYVDYFRAATAR